MISKYQILYRPALLRSISTLILFLTVLLIYSCNSEIQDKQNQEKRFYDVAGFVSQQVAQLNDAKPRVLKMTVMGTETNQIITTDIDWKKELELFSQADINKPAFRQSYSANRPDSSTYLYVSKEGDRLPVRQLKIVVDSLNSPVSIEAIVKSENKLYTSEKTIAMSCEQSGKGIRISSYRVKGFQKLVMMEKKPFLIDATIQN